MLVTTAPLAEINRSLRRENAVHAEGFHKPAFLVLGLVAGTCHRAGMAYGARQLGLPATDYAGHDWLAEFETVLVVTTGFRIQTAALLRGSANAKAKSRAA